MRCQADKRCGEHMSQRKEVEQIRYAVGCPHKLDEEAPPTQSSMYQEKDVICQAGR